ncbi:MAG: YrzE family protein [Bacilli bacterium]
MKYENLATSLEFSKEGNVFFKEIKGFKVYFKDWAYLIYSFGAFYIPCNKEITTPLLKKIEQEAFGNVGALFTISSKNDTLIMSLESGNKNEKNVQDKILAQMIVVCTTLQNEGYEPMKECPICHQEASFGDFGDNYVPIHEQCRNEYINKLTNLVNENKGFNTKYLVSIILSLVLGVVGIIPAVFVTFFNLDYFTGLIIFTPLLGTLGFFLSKAQSKKWLRIVTGIICFAIIFAFTFWAFSYIISQKEITFLEYMFSGKMVGLRKSIFTLILSLGGFGGTKFVSKFRVDYQKELDKFTKK